MYIICSIDRQLYCFEGSQIDGCLDIKEDLQMFDRYKGRQIDSCKDIKLDRQISVKK